MTHRQSQFIAKLALSSAIPPETRKAAATLVKHGYWNNQRGSYTPIGPNEASGITHLLQTIIEQAPPKHERPLRYRVASLYAKAKFYARRGDKPTIRPTAEEIAYAERQKGTTP